MNKTYAFIDEFGNHDLNINKGGASRFFVLAAYQISEKNKRKIKLGKFKWVSPCRPSPLSTLSLHHYGIQDKSGAML